jgi:hypothetical protein
MGNLPLLPEKCQKIFLLLRLEYLNPIPIPNLRGPHQRKLFQPIGKRVKFADWKGTAV